MRYLTLLIAVLISTQLLAQSPWTREEGGGFVQLNYTVIPTYNSLFTADDKGVTLPREISDKTIQLYGEYGLLTNTTIVANIPLKLTQTGAEKVVGGTIEEGKLNSLGNIELAVKQKLLDNNVKLALVGNFILPTGTYDAATGLRTGYDAFGFMPGVSVGGSGDKYFVYGYFNGVFYGNSYSSSIKTGVEAGVKPLKPLWLIVVVDVLESFENGSRVDPVNNLQTGLYVNNQEYLSYALKVVFEFKEEKLGVSASMFGAASGNYVAKSPSYNFGAYYKF